MIRKNAPSKSASKRPDRHCIRAFVAFLAAIGRPVSGVDFWPEDAAQNDIDAVAGPYAIQHTSVDTLPNQREHDARFAKVIEQLEDEFRDNLGFRLAISMRWGAIERGYDWTLMREAIRDWITSEGGALQEGRHVINIPGLPVGLAVTKGGPSKTDGVTFCRELAAIPDTLAARLRDQLVGRHDKLEQLSRWRERGRQTVLLIESHDMALMNVVKLVDAFESAFPVWPDGLDELWFIHNVAPPQINVSDLVRGETWIFDPASNNCSEPNKCTAFVRNAATLRR